MSIISRYQRAIKDFFYSFVAYMLPVAILQFAIQPILAGRLSDTENGLFLTLYSVVKLCVSVLVMPLTKVRLLHKQECAEDADKDKRFNYIFICIAAVSTLVSISFCILYSGKFDFFACVRLALVLLLVAAHDFIAIAYRVTLEYKKILINNLLLTVGYAFGIGLFFLCGYWEIIFVSGYTVALGYVLLTTKFWRRGLAVRGSRALLPQYGDLTFSAALNNTTIYCDKMLIFPILGGALVSIYNAASVVSKIFSLISVPVRNVLLSYIVDKKALVLSKRSLRKITVLSVACAALAYGCFYLASVTLCRLLYPQYFDAAFKYIYIILIATLVETCAGILNVILLRFSSSRMQIVFSLGKNIGYFAGIAVFVLLLRLELYGFCLAILTAELIYFTLIIWDFIRKMTIDDQKTSA